MKIDPASASAIVAEIGGILRQPVNIMDEKGIIVASSDNARMGMLHEGALRIIERGLDELVIESDREYGGARAGINLPIVLDGQIVGVIGLTGRRADVEVHGRIIKKMTEILLLDLDARERARLDRRMRANFLSEWLFGDELDDAFAERGLRIGVDVTLPRRILAISLQAADQGAIEGGYRAAAAALSRPGELILRTASQALCLIPDCSDEQIRALAERIRSAVSLPLLAGASAAAPADFRLMRRARLQAQRALEACRAAPENRLAFYDDLGVELLLEDVSAPVRDEFLRRVFRGIPPGEWEELVALLEAYYEADGSLERAAARLFLHKNTLQYRLRRLGELTGCDPRALSNAARYELAIRLYHARSAEAICFSEQLNC